MNTPHITHRRSQFAIAIALIAFAVGFRFLRLTVFPDLPNFAPLMAIALCGALVLPGTLALAVPLAALVFSDIALNIFYGVAPLAWGDLVRAGCYGIAVATGLSLRRMNSGTTATFAGVAANSVIFYVVSNSVAWISQPAYAKSAAGWLQALTVGLPGYPPTWTFFTWSFVSDMLFTAVFLGALHLVTRESREPAVAQA